MSIEKAQKIMDHLEGREAPNRGLSGAIGRMQRREYNEVRQEIANVIEGKPAVAAEPPKAEPDKGAPVAQGAGGGSGEATGKAGGKTGKV